jgi:hypothetical protein
MKPLVFLSIVCYRIWDAQCGFFMRSRWDHHIVWYLVIEWKYQYPSVRVFVSVTRKATLAKFFWELVVHVNSRSGVVKARSVVALCCGSVCSTIICGDACCIDYRYRSQYHQCSEVYPSSFWQTAPWWTYLIALGFGCVRIRHRSPSILYDLW